MRKVGCWALLALISCGSPRAETSARRSLDSVFESEEFAVPKTLLEVSRPNPKLVESDLLLATDYSRRHPGAAEVVSREILARTLLEELRAEAERVPPKESELGAARGKHWLEIDRPRSARFVSALVRVEPLAPDGAAFEIAKKIVEATRGDLSPNDFAEHAREIAGEGNVAFDVHVPVAEDGRAVPSSADDATFTPLAPDAFPFVPKLFEVGAISDVIGAREGFYVLFTVEVLPAVKMADEEARPLLDASILEERLRAPVEKLRSELRKAHPVAQSSRLQDLLPLAWNTR